MGLPEIQRSLARLYTDRKLRERFFGDPLAVGRELGLSAEETRQLAQLSSPHVHLSVDSAQAHSRRLMEICKLLPLTRRVLGERFSEYFRQYTSDHPCGGDIKTLFADALCFAAYLNKRVRADRVEPRWLTDVLRYEIARLKAANPARRCVVAFFRHDISRLVRSVARREALTAAFLRPAVVVWWRPERRGTVRYSVFPLLLFSRKRSS